ncbi:MAG: extracellular solute-binding protein [Alkalispirochaeta sp.]
MLDMSDVDFVSQRYDEGTRAPWQMEDGTQFATPLVAVSHGVYYNQDVFDELGLDIPDTAEEFLEVAEEIKDAGYIPVANERSRRRVGYRRSGMDEHRSRLSGRSRGAPGIRSGRTPVQRRRYGERL